MPMPGVPKEKKAGVRKLEKTGVKKAGVESWGQKAGVRSFIVQITFLITINDNCYAQ